MNTIEKNIEEEKENDLKIEKIISKLHSIDD
jgi:hypothetical protein